MGFDIFLFSLYIREKGIIVFFKRFLEEMFLK